MRLPRFAYASPKSVEEAVRLLGQAGGKAKILAGGTDLLPALKRRSIVPELIINIKEIDALREVEDKGNGYIAMGAAVGLRQMKDLTKWQAVSQAASRVAATELRNMGISAGISFLTTVAGTATGQVNGGGERFPATSEAVKSAMSIQRVINAGPAPALIAVGVKVAVSSATGSRLLPVSDLYRPDGAYPHTIGREEMVTHFHFPALPKGSGTSFHKIAKRQTLDFALVNAATRILLEADGVTCKEASAALSGSVVLPTVLPVDQLIGQKITPAILDEIAVEAVKHIGFITYAAALDIPVDYRRHAARVLLRQCLGQAWEKARNEVPK